MREKKILWAIFGAALGLWLFSLLFQNFGTISVFTYRSELTNLTGIIAFFFMGLIMILAVRPKWLEKPFHGLDKMYYLHKWAGIWAITAGGLHYLIRLSGKILKLYFEKGPKVQGEATLLTPIYDFLLNYKGLAKDVGEYTVWLMLIILALTLWHKFSYKLWRYSHKIMGAVFLAIVFHTLILTPINYWYQPLGLIFLAIMVSGSVCAVISLFGLIGKQATFDATIKQLEHFEDTLEITCQVEGNWAHKAGQYAFLLHDRLEGAHPFTISSADAGNQQIRFSIKALGDYTNTLQDTLKRGDSVRIEGPYGQFDFTGGAATHQVWIAGGVGVTPFIAWLESLQDPTAQKTIAGMAIDFYYCIRDEHEGVFASRLESLCAALPSVTLHIHYSDNMGYLTADQLPIHRDAQHNVSDIWFCGPANFAKALKNILAKQGFPIHKKFHQENFQMR